jgi:nitrogen regulatory protein P-II 1
MKKLSIVVHTSLQQELADLLRSLQLNNFMFSHIEEHSTQLEHDPFLSARDKVVGYVPQVRVDLILEKDRVQSLLKELRSARCTFKGKCFYWITDVDEAGEL